MSIHGIADHGVVKGLSSDPLQRCYLATTEPARVGYGTWIGVVFELAGQTTGNADKGTASDLGLRGLPVQVIYPLGDIPRHVADKVRRARQDGPAVLPRVVAIGASQHDGWIAWILIIPIAEKLRGRVVCGAR